MKRKNVFVLGTLALALALVFMAALFVGCDTGSDGTTYSLAALPADGSSGMYESVYITVGSPTRNDPGTSVTVTAEAKPGYEFVRWSNNIAGFGSVSVQQSYSFNIVANTTLYAVFKQDADNIHPDPNIVFPDPVGIYNATIDSIPLKIFVSGSRFANVTPAPNHDGSGSGRYQREGNVGIIYEMRAGAEIQNGAFTMTSSTHATVYKDGDIFQVIKETGSESKVANGTLTVNNLPSGWSFDLLVTTSTPEGINPTNPVADLYDHSKLRAFAEAWGNTAIPIVWFDTTGTPNINDAYMVVILGGNTVRYQTGVAFTDGSATIDYGTMNSW